ncbi:hypothetical protein ACFXDJ_31550 [Streptomyces sp. NPDC059443]|uniref:hypothetical protein n=1 Tax=unclassified Streptomyces TaxID=2593676 RepID=UPI0036D10E3B
MPGKHIPNSLEERQRLYRSVLATYAREGRRVLVVVTNASTTGQAGPLLPTDGITTTLVTSRHALDGLDARLHDLDTPSTKPPPSPYSTRRCAMPAAPRTPASPTMPKRPL